MTSSIASKNDTGTAQNEVTLALAQKESAEHMEGMQDLIDEMKNRKFQFHAYALDDPDCPIDDGGKTVKTIHFVRHGQGFHNLMADIATLEGREWVQVCMKKNQ